MSVSKSVVKILTAVFTPLNRYVFEPIEKIWPNWLSPRRWYVRFFTPLLTLPVIVAAYLMNYKAYVYPALTGDPRSASCAVLPKFMQKGIGPALTSTDWFPSVITSIPRTRSDWFYSFWMTMDWMLALSIGLISAFTVYSILKVLEIRSRAMALGESPSAAKEAGAVVGVGAATAILVTLATCWGPLLLGMIFGMTVVSFSGATDAMFHFTIPKPFVLMFVVAVVIGGTWWMKRKEAACHLVEGEH